MDITMCHGTNCNMKLTCLRFMAEKDPHAQSFFSDMPLKSLEDGTQSCDYYYLIKESTPLTIRGEWNEFGTVMRQILYERALDEQIERLNERLEKLQQKNHDNETTL